MIFQQVDTDGNMRLDAAEFAAAVPALALWGVNVPDAAAAFSEIDGDKSGYVRFDEFCVFAAAHGLDVHAGDGYIPDPEDMRRLQNDLRKTSPDKMMKKYAKQTKANLEKFGSKNADKDKPRPKKPVDWAAVCAKLPVRKTPEDAEARKKLFGQIDGNGNGLLSLAELDGGIRDVLGCGEVFEAKPAIARAFHAAKSTSNGEHGCEKDGEKSEELSGDYVELKEFRLFLV